MTLPAILCKKSQSKHGGGPHPSIPRGTAFLDQKRLSPTTIEKHYIGSMLYAFNFAEETHRAEGGQPLKVVRMLAEDLVRLAIHCRLGCCSVFIACLRLLQGTGQLCS
jgi:hypothetical protein